MGARLYETDVDRAKELLFAKKIEAIFKCQLVKLPVWAQMDFMITRGNGGVGIAELKCRNVSSAEYPTLVIGEHKLLRGMEWRRIFGQVDGNKDLALMVFVRYSDSDKLVKLTTLEGLKREKLTARNHADDPTDTEWVVHIPSERLRSF